MNTGKIKFEQNLENQVVEVMNAIYLEEEEASLEVAASFGTLSTLGTATGCASTLGTVSCFG